MAIHTKIPDTRKYQNDAGHLGDSPLSLAFNQLEVLERQPGFSDQSMHTFNLIRGALEQTERLLAKTIRNIHLVEDRLNLALDHSLVVICAQDLDLKYIWITGPFSGLSVDEMIGRTDYDLLRHEDADVLVLLKKRVIAERKPVHDVIALQVNERPVYWDLWVGPYLDEVGKVVGVHCVVTDVSERKKTEFELRSSLERFRLIAEHSPDNIFLQDADLKYIWMSKAIASMNVSDIIGRTDLELMDNPEEARQLITAKRQIMDSGEPSTMEVTLGLKGERRHFQATYEPWKAPDGTVLGLFGYVREITDQKRIEEALRQEEVRFRTTFDTAAIGLAHVGLDGRWLLVNDRLCSMLGYTRAEMLNMTFQEVTHPEDLHLDLLQFNALKRGDINSYDLVIRYIHKNGSIIWIRLTVALRRDSKGQAQYCISAIQDVTEQKRSEEELRESESRFRTMTDGLPFAVWVHDADGKQQFVNRTFAEYFGVRTDEMTGDRWRDLVHPEDGQSYLDEFRRCLAEQRVFHTRVRVRRADGQWRMIESNGRPRFTDSGLFLGMVGASIDVTERWEAETALRDREERFRLAARATNDAIWDWNLVDDTITWSQALADLFGWEEQETDGQWWKDCIHIDDRDFILSSLETVFKSSEDYWSGEYRFLRQDGSYAYIFDRGYLIRAEDGTPLRMVGAMVDLSEQKSAEKELRRAHDRLQILIESDVIGIVVGNMEGELLEANTYFLKLIGRTREELESGVFGWMNITPPEYLALDAEAVDAVRLHGRTDAYQKEYMRPDGTRVPVLVCPVLLPLEENHLLAYVLDMSSQKAAEQALHDLNGTLEQRVLDRTALLDQRNRELQQFAFVASHDLQEPLRKVQTFASLMKADYAGRLDEMGMSYLSRMENAAARMSSLLHELLSFSRVNSRPNPFHKVRVDELVSEVLQDLDTLVLTNNAQIEVHAAIEIDADPSQLRQLLNHLVLNAIKFQRPGIVPVVRISATIEPAIDREEVCRILVADNGIGFEMKYVDRVFEPFQRLHTRSEYPGTGMGLAICRRIVERHRGSITAESSLGKGSRFIVELPVKQSASN